MSANFINLHVASDDTEYLEGHEFSIGIRLMMEHLPQETDHVIGRFEVPLNPRRFCWFHNDDVEI